MLKYVNETFQNKLNALADLLQDVQKIKNIEKIKKITPIDEDLALEMKEEIKKGSKLLNTVKNRIKEDEKGSSSNKVLSRKVERILKLFNVSDLDDIVEVMEVDDETQSELGLNTGSDYQDDNEMLARQNHLINVMDADIEAILLQIATNSQLLSKERDLIIGLSKMLTATMEKVRSIKLVMMEHMKKAGVFKEVIDSLYTKLKDVQANKIKYLQKLKAAVDSQQSEAVALINRAETEAVNLLQKFNIPSLPSVDNVEMDDTSLETTNLETESSLKEIDSSKYDVYPLKKIVNVKGVKSLTVS